MSSNATPTFLRALLVPWSLGPLLFVGASAVLLALMYGHGVPGIVGSVFLISWLFKYAYVLLEHVANGSLEGPAASTDMLGPFEQRPLIQLAWCAVMYAAIRWLAGTPGLVLAGAVLIMLPASAAILGTGQGILRSLNPVALWRTVVGLGVLYPAILALIAAAGLVLAGLQRANAWSVLSFAVAELSVLTVFSAIGGALFQRRLELGHEPINSPEWRARQDDREHQRALSAMLDELYTQTRLKRRESALQVLQGWLHDSDQGHLLPDAHTIVERVAAWKDPIASALVGRLLTSELMRCGDADGAADINQRLASLTETHFA